MATLPPCTRADDEMRSSAPRTVVVVDRAGLDRPAAGVDACPQSPVRLSTLRAVRLRAGCFTRDRPRERRCPGHPCGERRLSLPQLLVTCTQKRAASADESAKRS